MHFACISLCISNTQASGIARAGTQPRPGVPPAIKRRGRGKSRHHLAPMLSPRASPHQISSRRMIAREKHVATASPAPLARSLPSNINGRMIARGKHVPRSPPRPGFHCWARSRFRAGSCSPNWAPTWIVAGLLFMYAHITTNKCGFRMHTGSGVPKNTQ